MKLTKADARYFLRKLAEATPARLAAAT